MSQLNFSVDQLFEQQATRDLKAIAVVDGGESWTYHRLNGRANRIAYALLRAGLQHEDIVALLLPRGAETIATILAVLKAGGAYLPLSISDPAARHAAILESAQPRALVTLRKYESQAAALFAGQIIYLDDISGTQALGPEPRSTPKSLCYVLFSSGSTGVPKGILVEHACVINLVTKQSYADFGPHHSFLHFAPLAFDAATFEIWGALLNGARSVILPEEKTSLKQIGQALRDQKVTTAWLTSGLFSAMVEQELNSLAGLQQLLTGGDVVSPVHARRFLDAAPGARLINGYGPTEATTFACCHRIPSDISTDRAIPVGMPLNNVQVTLVRDEICIAGVGLARGYLNDAELTMAKFIVNSDGDRVYKTGDLGRWREDGALEFLGRADTQVKLRGFRVELGEIECALLLQPGVLQAAVIAKPSGLEKQLVGFVVGDVNEAALGTAMSGALPDYMVPARLIRVEALPLTANGKVDRHALETMYVENPLVRNTQGTESEVARMCEGIFGFAIADHARPFMELGASSLQMMRAHGELQMRFGPFSIAEMFRHPSVSALARFLKGERAPIAAGAATAPESGCEIAIVGMAGRFPGARNLREFWSNLINGRESITYFEPEELDVPAQPGEVAAKPILEDAEMFDAAYFGILPKEAEVIDPQQRVFLECSVEALNDAGCDPQRSKVTSVFLRGRLPTHISCIIFAHKQASWMTIRANFK